MEMSQVRKSVVLPNVEFVGVPLDDNTSSGHAILSHEYSGVLEEYEITTSSGIPIRVYRQPSNSKSAILTYHDIGTNHTSFLGFFSYPEMQVISRHFTIYHVCAPGHHEGAEALTVNQVGGESLGFIRNVFRWRTGPVECQTSLLRPNEETNISTTSEESLFGRQSAYQNVADDSISSVTTSQYPRMDELAEMLTSVVDYFKIQYFIGFGMGAGSNILARFALHHPENVLALFLLNPNGTTHGYYEWFRNRWSDLPNLQRGFFTDNLLSQLEAHWFGFGLAENHDLVAFYTQLARSLNPVNLAGYIDSYINRTDLGLVRCLDPPSVIEQREREAESQGAQPTAIKVNCCLVTGALAQDLARALSDLNGRMDPRRTQFLLVPDCNGFLMEEDPDKLAVNFLHFLRNEGFLVCMTPEKLRKEASALQMELARKTNQELPSSAFMPEQEA
ncbi:protein NDRG3 [Echinococcus multilocularis]|uniref:Protein NDRG3 n=1 Tax=Echinococcus multilocularis TaxID=6211 RepID=A0A087W0Q4_ECHMU|nr:protein NDRG3 [Echinococcus multilocularis]